MKKKLLFHILICALLFVAITVPYGLLSMWEDIPHQNAKASPSADTDIVQDGDITVIGDNIELSHRPDFVRPGDNAKIEVLGSPNTLYDINVYYPSGLSEAKAFADQYSDENGKVCWEFKVSSRTTADKLRVVIRSESSYISFYIPVKDL